MTPHQVYLDALLEAISNEPFSSDDHREMLLSLKEHFAAAPDLGEELRRLYTVEGFSDFALALMWAQKQVDLDPGRTEPSADDQYLLSMKFRQALVGGPPTGELSPSTFDEAAPIAESTTVPEPAPEEEQTPVQEPATVEEPMPVREQKPVVAYVPTAPEDTFPQLLDKFVVATEAGVDDRNRLFDKVMNEAGEIGRPDSDYSRDLQEFCAKLVEFLSYAKRNEYMDDVRTMNILSTVSDAMASWSSASIESRTGLLTEGTKVLADARSHFE